MSALSRSFAVAGAFAFVATLSLSTVMVVAQRGALTPAACTVEPRPVHDATTPGAAVTPESPTAAAGADRVRGDIDRSLAEPADGQTVADVADALAEYAGCLNAGDRPRLLALLTERYAADVAAAWEATAADDIATPTAAPDGSPLLVAAAFEGWDAPPLMIASLRAQDVGLLPDGRAVVEVGWRFAAPDGAEPYRVRELLVLERAGDRWLVDYGSGDWLVGREVLIVPEEHLLTPAAGGAAPPSDDEILDRAREGFDEVDSAAYAEPTLVGAEFAVSATLMVGFVGDDDYEAVGCEMFVFERGAHSMTISALCQADEALTGRAAYLDVEVLRHRRSSDAPPIMCRDVAELSAYVTFACTVDLPGTTP